MAITEPGESNGRREWQRAVIGIVWPILFCIWFYSFDLPNNRDQNHDPVYRSQIWQFVPFELMDLLDPPAELNPVPWSWMFLAQRLPFLGIATILWAAALGIGRLELRALKTCSLFCRSERFFFAGCLGLSTLSLLVLGLGLMGLMNRWLFLLLMAGFTVTEFRYTQRDLQAVESRRVPTSRVPTSHVASTNWLPILTWSVVIPFVGCMLLGAMSPQTDFDVLEYHLGGPKEWFLQGRISRLPHNVYTSFPFLTEMVLLAGMVCYGDWQWGALAGQAAIAGFAPLAAVGLYATGKRWFSASVGWLAALIWLTTPWVYRISIIAYAEGGLACYLLATFAIALRMIWSEEPDAQGAHLPVICGLLAGSAMACKYTGLVSVVIPAGLLLILPTTRRRFAGVARPDSPKDDRHTGGPDRSTSDRLPAVLSTLLMFSAGIAISVGPWLIKNSVETGNPVYPLGYAVFGGKGRDSQMDQQWRRGHSRQYTSLQERLLDIPVKLTDVVANNDWHSALMFAFAPLALLASWRRKVWLVWGIVGWQFCVWFLFTHQIDRFYVPMFPVVALLAGVGASCLIRFTAGQILCSLVMGLCIAFNVWIMDKIGGFNAGRTELKAAQELVVSPSLQWINDELAAQHLPRRFKVLCVGEAALFHAKFPYVYNTVFDRSLFELWFAEKGEHGEFRLRSPDQIRATLKENQITHLLVNWSEILRYREPGSYGYTDFAHPDRLQELLEAGLLGPPLRLPDRAAYAVASEQKSRQIQEWAPGLGMMLGDQPAYRAVQIFPVQIEPSR